MVNFNIRFFFICKVSVTHLVWCVTHKSINWFSILHFYLLLALSHWYYSNIDTSISTWIVHWTCRSGLVLFVSVNAVVSLMDCVLFTCYFCRQLPQMYETIWLPLWEVLKFFRFQVVWIQQPPNRLTLSKAFTISVCLLVFIYLPIL